MRTLPRRGQAQCFGLNHAAWRDRREQDGDRSDGRDSGDIFTTDEDVGAGRTACKEGWIRIRDQGWRMFRLPDLRPNHGRLRLDDVIENRM